MYMIMCRARGTGREKRKVSLFQNSLTFARVLHNTPLSTEACLVVCVSRLQIQFQFTPNVSGHRSVTGSVCVACASTVFAGGALKRTRHRARQYSPAHISGRYYAERGEKTMQAHAMLHERGATLHTPAQITSKKLLLTLFTLPPCRCQEPPANPARACRRRHALHSRRARRPRTSR